MGFAILGYLLWRSFYAGGIDWLQVAFWAIFPDLAAFLPIGLSSKSREWPSWGSGVYNSFHTYLTWGTVFVVSWAAFGAVYWPLFGWLGHITVDRAVGYGLRLKTAE
jgi:hypothetical protein